MEKTNLSPFDPTDERQLIERLRAHDQVAMNTIYARYSNVVYAVAVRIIGQTAEAEDIVVDSFWQVWQQAGQLRRVAGTIAHLDCNYRAEPGVGSAAGNTADAHRQFR